MIFLNKKIITRFDQLEKNLERIDQNIDYFISKNKLTLPSLPKDPIKNFMDGLFPRTKLLIEPKIVGYSIAIKYVDGKFNSVINKKGKDVSNKIKAVKDVPKQVNIRPDFVVRGELFAPEEKRHISKEITSNFIRSTSYKQNPKISFCAFQIINARTNQYESLIYCREMGFTIPEFIETNRTSQVETVRQAWLSKKLFSNYPTDGLVVKINSRKLQIIREKSEGVYPYWQIAIK